VQGQVSVAGVKLTAEERFELKLVGEFPGPGKHLTGLAGGLGLLCFVLLGLGQLDQDLGLLQQFVEFGEWLQDGPLPVGLVYDCLGAVLVVPEVRGGGQFFQLVKLRATVVDVKDNLAFRRPSTATAPTRSSLRQAWFPFSSRELEPDPVFPPQNISRYEYHVRAGMSRNMFMSVARSAEIRLVPP